MVFPEIETPPEPVGGGVLDCAGSSDSEHAVKNEIPKVVMTAVIPARSINSLLELERFPVLVLVGLAIIELKRVIILFTNYEVNCLSRFTKNALFLKSPLKLSHLGQTLGLSTAEHNDSFSDLSDRFV